MLVINDRGDVKVASHHIGHPPTSKLFHHLGCHLVLDIAVAQAAKVAAAKGVELILVCDQSGKVVACSDHGHSTSLPLVQAHKTCRLWCLEVHVVAVPELPVRVASPRVHLTGACDRKAVMISAGKLLKGQIARVISEIDHLGLVAR